MSIKVFDLVLRSFKSDQAPGFLQLPLFTLIYDLFWVLPDIYFFSPNKYLMIENGKIIVIMIYLRETLLSQNDVF